MPDETKPQRATLKAPALPCAHDTRPLRGTLFPEHSQTILVYVPDGQILWLPPLPTPFDLDAVCDALDAHDVPHDTREGDRNRWWRNLQQSENAEKAAQGQQQRAEEATRHVRIHLSATATVLEQQRSEVISLKHKVDDEIRQLKVQIGLAKTTAATRGIYEAPNVFRQRERRLADLQTASIALQTRLSELKEQRRQQPAQSRSREERFIQKVKQHLTREQFLAIWTEIDAEDAEPTCPR